MIRNLLLILLAASAAIPAGAGPFMWKFDSSESWSSTPNLSLNTGFDGLDLLSPGVPEWGKPPVIYTLRETGSGNNHRFP